MKPGDLVRIEGFSVPMYPDSLDLGRVTAGASTHIGYISDGSTCVFLGSQVSQGSRSIIFHRLLTSDHGPVWVRAAWVKELE